jgi:hypothetical protein
MGLKMGRLKAGVSWVDGRGVMTQREEPRGLAAPIVCFTCGQTLPDQPSYHLLDQDDPCPACADRLLYSLSPVLQMSPQGEAEEQTHSPESDSKP